MGETQQPPKKLTGKSSKIFSQVVVRLMMMNPVVQSLKKSPEKKQIQVLFTYMYHKNQPFM